jgi:hypothetical protein
MSPKKLTCKGTLLQVFIRLYRLEIQSVMLVFSTQLWNCGPSNRLFGLTLPTSPPPPVPYVNRKKMYARIQCVGGVGVIGFWASDR